MLIFKLNVQCLYQSHTYNLPGSDNKIFIWNVGTGEALVEIATVDLPLSASWNYDGSRIITSSKDKKLRIIDPRTGNIIKVSKIE